MEDVDLPSSGKIASLHAQLADAARVAVDGLIDRRLERWASALGGAFATASPPSDAEVEAFRQEQTIGPPAGQAQRRKGEALEHDAARYALAQRKASLARAARRQGHTIELLLPSAVELERPLPDARVVARVDGRRVNARSLERAAALPLYRLRGEIDRERRRNLDQVIEERLLAREAARRGVSVEAVLGAEGNASQVTDAEVESFLSAERAAGREAPSAERARPYLQFRKAYAEHAALVQRLRAAVRIEVVLESPPAPRLPMVEAGAPALGASASGAGPRLLVYDNYRCGPCRAVQGEVDRLLAADPSLRVVFFDFVPVYDPVATEAALLVRCAARLGGFAGMRRELLGREPPSFGERWYDAADLATLARRSNLDPQALAGCLVQPGPRRAVERDTTRALGLGFVEAPAFIAEGQPLSGAQSSETLAQALRGGRSAVQ
jgi:protein-disulfide isomerase